MQIPTIKGIIDRRILVNFRVDADSLAQFLPSPFRPQLVSGKGIAGICLIRLKQVRPRFIPFPIGIGSENAAHRVAVEWDDDGQTKTGVFIPRRDTSSRLNSWAGGRIFPGVHHRATFRSHENNGHYFVQMQSDDGQARVLVSGQVTDRLNTDSIFDSLDQVSQFFQRGSLGYSPSIDGKAYDGLELKTNQWQVHPLNVQQVESSFFDDLSLFPRGSVEFDNALLMENIDHEWRGHGPICCDASP